MTEKQKEIMERINKIIYYMTEQQGEQFLAFGEGKEGGEGRWTRPR